MREGNSLGPNGDGTIIDPLCAKFPRQSLKGRMDDGTESLFSSSSVWF
jgi:hypothetical protein